MIIYWIIFHDIISVYTVYYTMYYFQVSPLADRK